MFSITYQTRTQAYSKHFLQQQKYQYTKISSERQALFPLLLRLWPQVPQSSLSQSGGWHERHAQLNMSRNSAFGRNIVRQRTVTQSRSRTEVRGSGFKRYYGSVIYHAYDHHGERTCNSSSGHCRKKRLALSPIKPHAIWDKNVEFQLVWNRFGYYTCAQVCVCVVFLRTCVSNLLAIGCRACT